MGRSIPQSKGCKVIRVTQEHDMTTKSGLLWLTGVARDIPRHIPILLRSSIPCIGGSRWVRFNLRQYPTTSPARLRVLHARWQRVFTNYSRICDIVHEKGGRWVIECPDGNAHWNNPLVLDFLAEIGSPMYEAKATGYAFGLRAVHGQKAGLPMRRAWLIEGDIPLFQRCWRSPVLARDTVHAQATGSNTIGTGKCTEAFVRTMHSMPFPKRPNESSLV